MYPFEFEILWRLKKEEPLAASELAEDLSRPLHAFPRTGPGVANQLRGLRKRGLVEADGGSPAIYRLSARGEEYVDA